MIDVIARSRLALLRETAQLALPRYPLAPFNSRLINGKNGRPERLPFHPGSDAAESRKDASFVRAGQFGKQTRHNAPVIFESFNGYRLEIATIRCGGENYSTLSKVL